MEVPKITACFHAMGSVIYIRTDKVLAWTFYRKKKVSC